MSLGRPDRPPPPRACQPRVAPSQGVARHSGVDADLLLTAWTSLRRSGSSQRTADVLRALDSRVRLAGASSSGSGFALHTRVTHPFLCGHADSRGCLPLLLPPRLSSFASLRSSRLIPRRSPPSAPLASNLRIDCRAARSRPVTLRLPPARRSSRADPSSPPSHSSAQSSRLSSRAYSRRSFLRCSRTASSHGAFSRDASASRASASRLPPPWPPRPP